MNERWKKLFTVSPFKIAVLVILIALVLFFIDVPFIRFMELKALDLRMVSRGGTAPGGETVIATIDEKSLSELGRWPWPRTTIARLIDTLAANGAKVVGLDIVFAEPDAASGMKIVGDLSKEIKDSGIADARILGLLEKRRALADTDAVLARSIEKAKSVILSYFFHIHRSDIGHLTDREIAAGQENIESSRIPMIRKTKGAGEPPVVRAHAVQPNLPNLCEAAENSGFFNVFPDSDGVIRWLPLLMRFRDDYYASMELSILARYLDSSMPVPAFAEYGVDHIRIGGIEIPTDEGGKLLINYLGPAKTFPHYSVSDILKGRIPPDRFKGKIVLVGATATGIFDLRVTPFSTVYPGVEIHATVIDNILHRKFLVRSDWTRFLDVCVIVLAGLVMGFAVPRVSALTGIGLSLGLICAFVAANTAVFIKSNTWMNLVYPLLTMMTIYLGITVYRYVTEEREKRRVRGAFQHYLNPSVVNEILKDPSKLKLGGDRKNLSVLFSDIRGFTSISEKLTPEELVHLLNEYMTAMTEIIFKYGGLLDKYIGDSIMAVFGAPLDQQDHALRACRTGIEMMDALRGLREKWAAEGRPYVDIGIGINTGDMVVGNMGSRMRFDYTVMGDSVNLASRLEGTNKEYGTNIIISEFTHAQVREELICRELDAIRVKGKERPVRIFELLGDRKDAAGWQVIADRFKEGLEKYRAGLPDEAIAVFQGVLELRPGDSPSRLYIERCSALMEPTSSRHS